MHIGTHQGSSPNQRTRNSILFTHRSILKSPLSNSLLITKKASGRWRPPSESSPGKPVIYYSISVWVFGLFFLMSLNRNLDWWMSITMKQLCFVFGFFCQMSLSGRFCYGCVWVKPQWVTLARGPFCFSPASLIFNFKAFLLDETAAGEKKRRCHEDRALRFSLDSLI